MLGHKPSFIESFLINACAGLTGQFTTYPLGMYVYMYVHVCNYVYARACLCGNDKRYPQTITIHRKHTLLKM